MKNKKVLIFLTTLLFTIALIGQVAFARGGSHSGSFSHSSSHSSFSSSKSSSSSKSKSASSGSFSKSSVKSKSIPKTTSSKFTSKKSSIVKAKTSATKVKTSTSSKTKPTRSTPVTHTIIHKTVIVHNSYHYSSNTLYKNSYGTTFHSSFWDNYFLYRAITHQNTVVVTSGGIQHETSYGYSGVWHDIVTLAIILGIITVIVVIIKRRR